MAVYISIILFLYISTFVSYGKLRKYVYWISVTTLAVISGIRYNVGTDFIIQIKYYNWTLQGTTSSWLEPGFRLYIKFIDAVFGNFQWYIFIASIFVIFTFGNIIYQKLPKRDWFFALTLFVVSTIFFATMNLVRQYIATAFLLYAYECLKQKKYFKVAIYTAIAISFHMSAIAFTLSYLLYYWIEKHKELDKVYKIINLILIIAIVGGIVDIRSILVNIGRAVLPSKYVWYLTSKFFNEKNWLSLLKMIVPFVVWTYIYYFFSAEKKKQFREYLPFFVPWFTIDALFGGVNVFLRIAMYFEWVLLLMYPTFVNCFNSKANRMLLKNLFLIFYVVLTVYSIFFHGGHGVVPYQTFLQT